MTLPFSQNQKDIYNVQVEINDGGWIPAAANFYTKKEDAIEAMCRIVASDIMFNTDKISNYHCPKGFRELSMPVVSYTKDGKFYEYRVFSHVLNC